MNAARRILVSISAIGAVCAATHADAATFYVGAASCDITPEMPSFLAGQFSPRISTGTEYPLTANILTLESRAGGRTLDSAILISIDTCVPRAGLLLPVRQEVQRQLPGFDLGKLIVAGTHIGDAVVCTNQFELYTDFAIQMKARSKAVQTLVVQLANGAAEPQPADRATQSEKTDWEYRSSGTYLPSERAKMGGGYGAVIQSNVVGPEGGQVLVEETLKMINDLW
jgi:hypothetical protein